MRYPAALAVTLAAVLTGCGKDVNVQAERSPNRIAESPKGDPPQIRVETVREREAPLHVVTAPGKIEANTSRISRVLPPVAGRVVEVLVKFGDAAAQGQPVAVVESPEADAAVSSVLQAEAALSQTISARTKAEADLERLRDLYENKAIARKELLQAEKEEAQTRAGVKQAEAALQQANRRLEILDLKKDQFGQRIVVRAPIPGKVLEVNVAPGEFRNDPNAPLLTIADLSTVWVTADVPETEIRFIQRGERVQIHLAAYPDEVFSGSVTQIADLVDPQTRTVKVRAQIDNRHGRLRPEMYGQIRHIESYRTLPFVPIQAVVQMRGRSVVMVETRPGKYEPRDVEIGERIGDMAPVVRGLRAGERVVADGALLLRQD